MLLAFGQVNTNLPRRARWRLAQSSSASWTREVFNDLPGDNEIELLAKVEVSCVRAHHVETFSPENFDLILFIIQPHQVSRLLTENAVKPMLGLTG